MHMFNRIIASSYPILVMLPRHPIFVDGDVAHSQQPVAEPARSTAKISVDSSI